MFRPNTKLSRKTLKGGVRLDGTSSGESQYADIELAHKIEHLRLERLSNREIVDKLVESGYPRETVIAMLQNLLKRREIPSDVTSPFIFMVATIVMVIWGLTPTALVDPNWVGPFKILITIIGLMVGVPSATAFIYKTYDHIPGLRTILEPIMAQRRTRKADIVALDMCFLGNEIPDREYEDRLVMQMGKYRGKRHFRKMRNQKHFGLE